MISNKIIKYMLLKYPDRIYNLDLSKIIYRRLDKYLYDEKILNKNEHFEMLVDIFKVRNDYITYFDLNKETVNKLSLDWIEYYKMIPFDETVKKVKLLIDNPFDIFRISMVEQLFEKKVEVYFDELGEIQQLINLISIQDFNDIESDKKRIDKVLESIIISANNQQVSDIHFDIKDKRGCLYFRKDGSLIKFIEYDLSFYYKLLNKIKILSKIDITISNQPLDGSWTFEKGKNRIDIRVSTIPTIEGERIVLRLLNYKYKNIKLSELGFNEKQYNDIISALKGGGIIFLTGPTGSGKTTTLYAMLEFLKNNNKNIMTIEDPIERKIEGISQIPLNSLSYSQILKNIIRQDPDIIMIGEIRDSETAQMAIKLAQTGHLILTTIHSKDSLGVLLRLENLGIDKHLIVDTLKLIVSQRLLRVRCCDCLGKIESCKKCYGTGYSGRILLGEVLKFNNYHKELMSKNNYKELIFKELKNDLFINVYKPLLDNNVIEYDELIQAGLVE